MILNLGWNGRWGHTATIEDPYLSMVSKICLKTDGGIPVHPWLINVNVWQNHHNIVK